MARGIKLQWFEVQQQQQNGNGKERRKKQNAHTHTHAQTTWNEIQLNRIFDQWKWPRFKYPPINFSINQKPLTHIETSSKRTYPNDMIKSRQGYTFYLYFSLIIFDLVDTPMERSESIVPNSSSSGTHGIVQLTNTCIFNEAQTHSYTTNAWIKQTLVRKRFEKHNYFVTCSHKCVLQLHWIFFSFSLLNFLNYAVHVYSMGILLHIYLGRFFRRKPYSFFFILLVLVFIHNDETHFMWTEHIDNISWEQISLTVHSNGNVTKKLVRFFFGEYMNEILTWVKRRVAVAAAAEFPFRVHRAQYMPNWKYLHTFTSTCTCIMHVFVCDLYCTV